MQFAIFATHLAGLEKESSRLKITSLLADLLSQLSHEEIKIASYLLQGQLTPSYINLEFQLSVKMILRALSRLNPDLAQNDQDLFGQAVGDDLTPMNKQYKKLGDVGELAAQIVAGNKIKENPDILAVYDRLVSIARESGAGSQDRKLTLLTQLLSQVDPQSAKVIVRIIVGRLRLGFSTLTMFDALSQAVVGDKSERELLLDAYARRADLGELAVYYLELKDLDAKKREQKMIGYTAKLGIPLVPALCQRLNTTEEMIEKMDRVYAEPKYDGLRAQLHFDGQAVRVFTRNLDDVTHMFPEAQQLISALKCQNCILDSEVIGVSEKEGKLLRFQETATRKRKHDIEQAASQVPVKFFIFDMMYLDDRALVDMPLSERKSLLRKNVLPSAELPLALTEWIETSDAQELRQFHEKQLELGLEGVVVKKADSLYRSGRTGWRWVKIKEAEGNRGKLSDTLDVVVMGYYLGRGKRTAFGLGAVLVGVLNTDGQVVSIAKIGTGMTEAQLSELKEKSDAIQTDRQPQSYEPVDKTLIPDVWVKPGLVLEVAGDELTTSSVHRAGVALRFPRLLKIRLDKSWQEATTTDELPTL